MSRENIIPEQLTSTERIQTHKVDHISKRVNINELLSNVRKEKIKEKKESYIFLAAIFVVIAITGIIASI